MPIPLPNLDDRAFTDLVAEARALIPRYAPQWTDHNLSDPGITLVELFAWLTEMIIYRLNRIPEASEARFVELLGAGFSPARPAVWRLIVSAGGLNGEPLVIARGTPLSLRPAGGGPPVAWETLGQIQLAAAAPSGLVDARQSVLLEDRPLGNGNGRPHQVILLPRGQYPVFEDATVSGVGVEAESALERPALMAVNVGPEPWTYQSSLLQSTASDRHFTLDRRLNALRFGDGSRGQVPPAGEPVTVTYLATQGWEGNLASNGVLELDSNFAPLPPTIAAALHQGVSISITREAIIQAGANPTSLEEARTRAITNLKSRWRCITAEDFQEIALREAGVGLARAVCLPELDLTSDTPYAPAPGHVSVIIVPHSPEETPSPDQATLERVWEILDRHRLITCRHHVVGPEYTPVRIGARVVRNPQVTGERLAQDIQQNLRAFFHPLGGGSAGQGWPFGREVHASEVYQVMEETPGVDHVESLRLFTREAESPPESWTDAGQRLEVPPNGLVHFVASAHDLQIWARQ